MKKLLIFLLFVFYNCETIFAFDTPFFFKGARPAALGDAFTAVADDENAISYNPAGLINIKKNKIAISGKIFSYDFLNENYINNYAGFHLIFSENFGFQVFYDLLGDKVTLSENKNFLYEGLKITGAFAYDLKNGFYTGLSGNVIVQTGKAGGVAFDAGFIYKFNSSIKIGCSIKHFISSGNFLILDDSGDVRIISYPFFVNAGISFKPFENFLLSFEIKNIFENKSYLIDSLQISETNISIKRSYHLGIEYGFFENFYVLSGVNGREDIFDFDSINLYKMRYEICAGLGFKFEFIKINFSLTNDFREIGNIKSPLQIYFSVAGDY